MTSSKGLKTKQVGFAGLDVYEEEEPYFYKDKSDKIIDDDNAGTSAVLSTSL